MCAICGSEPDISCDTRDGRVALICYGCARSLGELWKRKHLST